MRPPRVWREESPPRLPLREAPTPTRELRCGAYLLGAHVLFSGAFWEGAIARVVGHRRYRVVWAPTLASWAVYRLVTPEEKKRHGIGGPDPTYLFRFQFIDERKAALTIDHRIVSACQEDDVIFKDPQRYQRTKMDERARRDAAFEKDWTRFEDAFTRDVRNAVADEQGHRCQAGYGTTGESKWRRKYG